MIEIRCAECGKLLFTFEEDSIGKAAAEATRRGFVTKMPIFYGIAEFKIFCDDKCKDAWFAKLSDEVKADGRETAMKFKEDFKKNIPTLQKKLAKIQELCRNFRTKNKTKK